MSNIDVEIYFSQFKTFFVENPKELRKLIGIASDEEFFNEVYLEINNNHERGEEVVLTQKQIIEIVLKLNKSKPKDINGTVDNIFQKTDFGLICLN